MFRNLTKEETAKIAGLLLGSLRKRLAVMGVKLYVTDLAMDLIIEKGYDEQYGARPLKRVIQRNIEDRLSEEILKGNLVENSSITVDEIDGEFSFRKS